MHGSEARRRPLRPRRKAASRRGCIGWVSPFRSWICAQGAAGQTAPLRQLHVARVPKYDATEITDVSRPYDGLFYIERMKPATLVSS
jgi:hypothetical protein